MRVDVVGLTRTMRHQRELQLKQMTAKEVGV